jgi:hypothetical protein
MHIIFFLLLSSKKERVAQAAVYTPFVFKKLTNKSYKAQGINSSTSFLF